VTRRRSTGHRKTVGRVLTGLAVFVLILLAGGIYNAAGMPALVAAIIVGVAAGLTHTFARPRRSVRRRR